jgi:hypothetical protein
MLTPAGPSRLPGLGNAATKPRSAVPATERLDFPLTVPKPDAPRVSFVKTSNLRPHLLTETAPLAFMREDPDVPLRPEPESLALVREPSQRVHSPASLPVQAKQLADRASLEDPTMEFSLERATANPAPLRTAPLPFMRLNLPEPFEHRATAKPIDREPAVVAPVPMPPK